MSSELILLRGVGAPIILRSKDAIAIVDASLLQQELADCSELTRERIIDNIIYWLKHRCHLSSKFVKSVTEVHLTNDAQDKLDWKVAEWLVMALHVHTGTCIQYT